MSSRTKLAIVSTHPIQYYAPVFRALATSPAVQPRVFYTWSQAARGPVFDAGFGARLEWDIPLLEGYDHEFVPNVAKEPGSHRFRGIRNPTLNAAIARWGADALLVQGWNLQSHLQALRHFKGRIPVFFRGDSTIVDARTPLRALARRVALRWVYRHIDVAIAVGRNNRDYFAWCGLPPERIAFAPHSVDTRRFATRAELHDARALQWRHELGICESDRVLLYAGKFIPVKDPCLLIDAFLRVQEETRAHLVFVGGGALEGELRQRATGNAFIHFMPFQNQSTMPAVYRLGDVFVLPSRGPETWGLALNEAMASGRAILAGSRVGAARDLVCPGENGWVFESGSLASLTHVLRKVLRHSREELLRVGQAGQRMSPAWSSEETARRIAQIVSSFRLP